jgi:hypothetical protein
MIDVETFLITLYVMVDDLCKSQGLDYPQHPGPQASLSCSEVITLALFGQWAQFASERDFYRYAQRRLSWAFPRLPDRSQFNRHEQQLASVIAQVSIALADALPEAHGLYEILDSSGVPVRHIKRRGGGWLAGIANKGWCSRISSYCGFHLLLSCTPTGLITGFGFAPASTHDAPLADTFLAARRHPTPRLPGVGHQPSVPYVADRGFAGDQLAARFRACYQAELVTPPHHQHVWSWWTNEWRRWLTTLRQEVESVYNALHNVFRLSRERPHALAGFQARLAAKVGLQNFCCWLNHTLQRDFMAFVDLLAW